MAGLRRSGRSSRPSSVLTLHVGGDTEAFATGYPKRSPVLSVRLGSSVVLLGTNTEDRVGADDVTFARELAKAAGEFADLCERMYRGVPTGLSDGVGVRPVPARADEHSGRVA